MNINYEEGRTLILVSKIRRSTRKKLPALFLCFMLMNLAFLPSANAAVRDEYRTKAMMIQALVRYVNWPPEAGLDNRDTPFIVAVFEKNPFNTQLDDVYLRKRIKSKRVKIRYINNVNDINDCHVLFIPELSRKKLSGILEYTRSRPILTLGDTAGYAKRGVHMNIRPNTEMRGREIQFKLRLEVNETAAREAGLVMTEKIFNQKSLNISFVEPYEPYQDKAEKLKNLISFVDWPTGSGMDDVSKPFVITVFGENVFESHLENIFKRNRAKNKMVEVRTAENINQVRDSQILVIPGSKKNEVPKILEFTKNKPILLIGDFEGFARQGGHLNFFYDFARLSFEINNTAARNAGFVIRSSLLKHYKLVPPVIKK